jgi:hypothetical protein
MSNGWIKLYRSICDNPLWTIKPFSKAQAWIDMLINANHKDGYFFLREHKIIVKRGQLGWSQLKLANRWGWSRSKVRNFLNHLEKEQQIEQLQSHSTSIVTILNYEKYQQKGQQDVQQQDNSGTTGRTTAGHKQECKEGKEGKEDIGDTPKTPKTKSFKTWTEKEFAYKALDANNGRLSEEQLIGFVDYWTEKGEGVKLMKFQRQQNFDLSRRIGTWERNARK